MDIEIGLIDSTLPIPEKKTGGAAGIDLYAREDVTIPTKSIALIPLNVIIKTPPGYVTLLLTRSSTHKKGLMAANSVGIIDPDYSGPTDELQLLAYNFTDHDTTVQKLERIAQIIIVPTVSVNLHVSQITGDSRGGFGTTGF